MRNTKIYLFTTYVQLLAIAVLNGFIFKSACQIANT